MSNEPKCYTRNESKVDVPNELLVDMEIESVVISPVFQNVGIVILAGDDQETNCRLVRIYSIAKQDDETTYRLVQELQAFLFPEKSFAKEFIERLPQMSAIELMFAMNGMNDSQFH